ncbi:MAG: DUF3592 domain-containing protein [Ilumatobacteraceae bacterium]
MNVPVFVGALVAGVFVVGLMRLSQGAMARRWRSLAASGIEVTGTAVGTQVHGGGRPWSGWIVSYPTPDGAEHRLTGLMLGNGIQVGQAVQVRFPADNLRFGVVDERWVVTKRGETTATLVCFAILAIIAGFLI